MSNFYIINKNPQITGEHEVHLKFNCNHLPLPQNQIDLGLIENNKEAIRVAKNRFSNVKIDGCAYCMPDCNNG